MPKKKAKKASYRKRPLLSNSEKFSLAIAILVTICALFINMFTSLLHETAMHNGGWFLIAYKWVSYLGFASVILILWWIFKGFANNDKE